MKRSERARTDAGRVAFRLGALASVVTVLATLTIGAPAHADPVPQPATGQRGVTAWNTFADAGGHFTQGDATYTHKLLDGRIVWLFADSFLGETEQHDGYSSRGASPMLKNQVLVEDPSTDPPTFRQVWPAGVPDATTWTGIGCAAEWPLASIQTTLTTFQTLLRCVDSDMKVLRIDVATTTFPADRSDVTNWSTSISFLGSAFVSEVTCGDGATANVEYGSSVLQTWGGPTYIYGLQRCDGFTHTTVAKVDGNDLLNGTWSYWSADGLGNVGWHGYYAGVPEPIEDTAGGNVIHAGDEFSVVATGSGLRMLTSDVGIGPIVKYTAEPGAYTGPFTQDPAGAYYFTPPEIGQLARQTGTPDPTCTLTTYGAKEHPALESGGNLVFSYNVNVPKHCALDALPADLLNYRARFYTVPAA